MKVSPFPTVALPALCQIGFLINRQGGFCICTMLARVLVYKNGAHEGQQTLTGKPP